MLCIEMMEMERRVVGMMLQCKEEKEEGRRRRKEGYARTREEGDEESSVEVEAGSPDTAEKEDGGWDE